MPRRIDRVVVIDTHTGGEPTRVVVSGGPNLGRGTLAERLARFRDQHDTFRSAVVNEPRGSDVMVGALLCEPSDASCATGMIFFNNVGYLGMCGHGTIGVAVALAHLGRISTGMHRFETPVGVIAVTLETENRVSLDNVPSYRSMRDVVVSVPGLGRISGDVAWGGNWFFLVHEHQETISLANAERLTEVSWTIRHALNEAGIRGDDGGEIDHIELYGPSTVPGAHSKNFVLCPGKAYDRSPCGTGTSAKLACLLSDGTIGEGEIWRQESLVGSIFEGSARIVDGEIIPTIKGTAYVNAESTLILDSDDPFASGIRV
ncbi:MAG: 4-hydroxyproline 2-epimerase [Planctomycetota bacterium]|nr:4-hydroxyproline 2-epimerase [Planctomycetota bacterium]